MEKIKVIIVDDEKHCIESLAIKLNKHYPQVVIMERCFDVESAYKAIELYHPDIVFLDISMPGGDGFTLLEKYQQIPFEVIFTTAYDKFALQAIQCNALHFLLKPIKEQDLIEAIKRYQGRINPTSIEQVLSLVSRIRSNYQEPLQLAIPTGQGFRFVSANDIVRFQPNGNLTTVFLEDGTSQLTAKTVKEFESMLDSLPFIRIHHSHLINLAFVKEYKKALSIVVMRDGTEIELSARKKTVFLENISKFVKI